MQGQATHLRRNLHFYRSSLRRLCRALSRLDGRAQVQDEHNEAAGQRGDGRTHQHSRRQPGERSGRGGSGGAARRRWRRRHGHRHLRPGSRAAAQLEASAGVSWVRAQGPWCSTPETSASPGLPAVTASPPGCRASPSPNAAAVSPNWMSRDGRERGPTRAARPLRPGCKQHASIAIRDGGGEDGSGKGDAAEKAGDIRAAGVWRAASPAARIHARRSRCHRLASESSFCDSRLPSSCNPLLPAHGTSL